MMRILLPLELTHSSLEVTLKYHLIKKLHKNTNEVEMRHRTWDEMMTHSQTQAHQMYKQIKRKSFVCKLNAKSGKESEKEITFFRR